MTQPPVPWKDDPDVDTGLREDLRAVQGHAGAYDRRRGLARLEAAIATGASVGVASAAQDASAASSTSVASASGGKAVLGAGKLLGAGAMKGALAKAVVAGVAVVTVTSSVWVATQRVSEKPAVTAPAPAQHAEPETPPVATPEANEVSPAARSALESADSQGPPEAEVPSGPAPKAPTSSGTTARQHEEVVRGSEALRQEMAQLQRARALLDPDPAAAYELLRRSSRRFSEGLFVEERDALSVLALAGMGKPREAKARARRFAQRFPQSTFNAHIRAALEGAIRDGR